MAQFRTWLNQHPLAAPYRGLRDLLRISANRRQILQQISALRDKDAEILGHIMALRDDDHRIIEQAAMLVRDIEDQKARLDRLERLEHGNAQMLKKTETLLNGEQLPFSYTQPAPTWIANAERLLGQGLAELAPEQKDHWFYSFYSEMAGGVGHILEQQYQVYMPLLPAIPGSRVLDIGCGAGEFLNFLRRNGVPAMGIDLDAHEVERANERGLTAVHAEATQYLTNCEEKFAAITLFQVIEHVPPALIRPLIEACVGALAPGGALLIETVNMRNPNAVNGFYTDPTHQIPLSDNYMSFVFQWNQLEKVDLIYTLPEWVPGISTENTSRCYANYTVIGYKAS